MRIKVITIALGSLLLCGCANEFNKVYKSQDYNYKYEYAKEMFAKGKNTQAITLLQELVTIKKGSDDAEECLYMLGMAEYNAHDYESASETFKKYFQHYPKGIYAERACYYIGKSLAESAPEPRLDQSPTIGAINAFQEFLDFFPDSKLRPQAQQSLLDLTDNLVTKELLSARLYYNLGDYFGNCTSGGSNFEACIVTSQNALKQYPYTDKREEFYLLIMKSKFELAEQSIEEKQDERYRDAEDECYGFINEFPDSENKDLAERYISKCKKITEGKQ